MCKYFVLFPVSNVSNIERFLSFKFPTKYYRKYKVTISLANPPQPYLTLPTPLCLRLQPTIASHYGQTGDVAHFATKDCNKPLLAFNFSWYKFQNLGDKWHTFDITAYVPHAMNPLYFNNSGLLPGPSENDIQKVNKKTKVKFAWYPKKAN